MFNNFYINSNIFMLFDLLYTNNCNDQLMQMKLFKMRALWPYINYILNFKFICILISGSITRESKTVLEHKHTYDKC